MTSQCEATTLKGERCWFRGYTKAPNGQKLCGVHTRRAKRLGLAGWGRR